MTQVTVPAAGDPVTVPVTVVNLPATCAIPKSVNAGSP